MSLVYDGRRNCVAIALWELWSPDAFVVDEARGSVHRFRVDQLTDKLVSRANAMGEPQIIHGATYGPATAFDLHGQQLWSTRSLTSIAIAMSCSSQSGELLASVDSGRGHRTQVFTIDDAGNMSKRFDLPDCFERMIDTAAGTCSERILARSNYGIVADVTPTMAEENSIAPQSLKALNLTHVEHVDNFVFMCAGKSGVCVVVDTRSGCACWTVRAKSIWPSFHAVANAQGFTYQAIVADLHGIRAYDCSDLRQAEVSRP
jgi:hypothetical protein